MAGVPYIYWQDGEYWLGYFAQYPDYMTQGRSMDELEENLLDLYQDIKGGDIPATLKMGELQVP